MAVELFSNLPSTTVASGGTTAPASGTVESWTVASSASFPAASSGATPPTQFHVADILLNSEIIAVTNVSGTTWTVTRGAEGTTPVPHVAGFTVYQVSSAGALTQLRSLDWLNVVTQFGADNTGAADSTSAIQAAISALPSTGGVVYLPAGTYKITSTLNVAKSGIYLIGDGRWITTLAFTGTGDCISVTDASTYATRTVHGGGVLGLSVDGTGSGAGSCALHAGDILNLRFDIAVNHFTGSGDIGLHLDNRNFWTEQASGVAYFDNCAQSVVFDCSGALTSNSSYDRGDFTFYLSVRTFTGNVVTMQNGAHMVGGRLRMFGNINSSSSPFTAAVLQLTGSTPAGHSQITNTNLSQCEIDINVESDLGLANTYQTVNFGSTSNVIFNCSGNMSFGPGNQFTASNVTSVSTQFTYTGPVIGDSTLAQANFPGRLSVNSSTFFFSSMFFGGITGANAGFRIVGATASGAPVSGTFSVGDLITSQDGTLWVCTTAGTPGTWMPLSAVSEAYQQYGYLGWTYDPAMGSGGALLPTAGGVTLCKIPWPLTQSVTNIVAVVVAGGSSLTAGQCFAGLYSSSGTRLGVTADQASAWGAAGTVPKTMAISGGPITVAGGGPAGFIYAGFMWNGTTAPQFLKASNNTAQSINGALAAASLRTAVNGSGNTSLPSSLTLSSSTAAGNLFWAALS